jgi:hypothetical protein
VPSVVLLVLAPFEVLDPEALVDPQAANRNANARAIARYSAPELHFWQFGDAGDPLVMATV